MKKIALKIHRILGSLLSLVFAVWFLSGFVMLFYGFPHAPAESLFKKQTVFAPSDSIQILNQFPVNTKSISLEKFNCKAIYRITDAENNAKVLDAYNHMKIDSFSSKQLDILIERNYHVGYYQKTILNDFDAWIPWSHYRKYFPIHKYYLNDSLHTIVYASSKTGEIVQETNRKKRWMARFGAIPHWFYFKSLRLKKDTWSTLIIWISGIGSIMCLFGIIIGFYHYRKPKKHKRKGVFTFSPYKKKWYRWHHISGFFFGIIAFTFVFSGMMSLQKVPKFIVPVKNEGDYTELWNKKRFDINDFTLPVSTIINHDAYSSFRKIEWCFSTSEIPYYKVYLSDVNSPLMVSAIKENTLATHKVFSQADIENEFKRRTKIQNIKFETITSTDGYYFEQPRTPFPVVKAIINDKDKTWLYINPRNLEIVKSFNRNTRLRRWLYKGLHSFNFKQLANNNALRIIILFVLSIFGTVISVSGLVLSYKYVKRKL